nr:hypothetical protein [uncultured Methanoregula sp.]
MDAETYQDYYPDGDGRISPAGTSGCTAMRGSGWDGIRFLLAQPD